MMRRLVASALMILPLIVADLGAQRSPAPMALDTARYSQLKFRYIGPEGNRVSAVAGVAGDPNIIYAGAASGGIFKTVDGGTNWRPIFDDQPVASIGALAVAPSDPNVVWAGTGEAFIRSHISIGAGVYRSTDAGKTWTRVGLENTGRIARIAVDPKNPDVALVAALGTAYGPQPDRGIFRTSDGGKSWDKVLFVNDSTGGIDVVMDPSNSRILFAAMWQIEVHTWGRESGGAGSGIFMSRDGGSTWKRLSGSGLPTQPVGRIGLAIARSNPNRIYALIETSDGNPVHGTPGERGELWRSDDGGSNWQVVSYDRQLAGRTQYYSRMAVAPDNENEAYFLSAAYSKTIDGGKTTIDPPFAEQPYGDHHDMWIDPTNPSRMLVASDGGVSVSTTRGKNWLRIALPVAQMYHVTTDDRVPYRVYGNRQDGPSAMGPSNSKYGFVPRGAWQTVGGGESGWATPDPENPDIVWSSASGYGSSGGVVTRYDARTGVTRNVEVWPEAPIGWAAADLKYRFVWTFPLTISPFDHNRLYVGSQFVHTTTDGGASWQVISPDLTRNDKSRQQMSGGLTPDNIGVEYSGVVFAIAESRLKSGLIWAGTNDGQVQLTRDGGKTWTNLSANLPGMPAWGTISNIEPSRYDTATAYLTVDGHQVNNRDPWVYKTTDYGKSWRLITAGIPRSPVSYAHVVREDPVRRGMLYLGTEGGLYLSLDDGDSWQPLQNNLPHAPVYWLTIQERFNDLVVATYGRGFWILDDITPLREIRPDLLSRESVLLPPRDAWRLKPVEPPFSATDDPTAGQDPTYGASLHYWLKSAAKDSVTLTITDGSGRLVRTLKGPKDAGISRVWWNLRGEQTRESKMRTSPLYTPDVTAGPDGRPTPDFPRLAVLVPPGTYTVTLSAGGSEQTKPLVVRKDPVSGGSDGDITAQTAFVTELRDALTQVVNAIDSTESARSQLMALQALVGSDSTRKDLVAAADSLNQKLIAVETELAELRQTGRGQDDVRWPMRLGARIGYLAQGIEGSDFAPTAQQREVSALLRTQLQTLQTRLAPLLGRELAEFNARIRARGVQPVTLIP